MSGGNVPVNVADHSKSSTQKLCARLASRRSVRGIGADDGQLAYGTSATGKTGKDCGGPLKKM